ncbi:MAG: hypothetical protein HYV35_04130 [Lentisphaerae bacterium]|nr:hypothetical protein [Lentisphaerota bacterium]
MENSPFLIGEKVVNITKDKERQGKRAMSWLGRLFGSSEGQEAFTPKAKEFLGVHTGRRSGKNY